MKKILPFLLTLIFTTVCFADSNTAYKIAKILNAPLFKMPSDTSLSEKEMLAELERRRVALDKMEHVMAEQLEKEMSTEELKETLDFLTSPTGKKFFATINGKAVMDKINQITDK
ncbi:DUF2059 domain-containing protein [Coraliomargarita sp. W4R53]|jgi:predicted GTPase